MAFRKKSPFFENIGKYLGIAAAIATIIPLIFYVIDVNNKNTRLIAKNSELESVVQALQPELDNLKSSYRELIIRLVMEGRVVVGELEGVLPEAELREVKSQAFSSSIPVPADIDVYFHPTGWMSDGEQKEQYFDLIYLEDYIKITYTPGPEGWVGMYWQYPENNWGQYQGRNVTKARELTFWAKGEQGSEIVEFKAGGTNDPNKEYRDSFEVSLGRQTLSSDWEEYTIALDDQDLSNVIGAFAWVASKRDNPVGATFYLKEIYFR